MEVHLLISALVVVCVFGWYFMPTIIGKKRKVSHVSWLFLLNLVIGWTVVGWFICLLWAIIGKSKYEDDHFKRLYLAAQKQDALDNAERYAKSQKAMFG